MRPRTALLSLAVALTTIVVASPPALANHASHFPLQVGNVWEYEVVNASGAATERVSVDARWRSPSTGLIWHRLRGYQGDQHWVRTSSANGVFEFPNRTWYGLNRPSGPANRWRMNFDIRGGGMATINGADLVIEDRNATVAVPAGEFTGCVSVSYFDLRSGVFSGGSSPYVATEWFAPGIGLIRRTVQNVSNRWDVPGAQIETWVLRSATVGGRRFASKPPVSLSDRTRDPSFAVTVQGNQAVIVGGLLTTAWTAGGGTIGLEVDGRVFTAPVRATTDWEWVRASDEAISALRGAIEGGGFVVEEFGRFYYSASGVRWKIWRR